MNAAIVFRKIDKFFLALTIFALIFSVYLNLSTLLGLYKDISFISEFVKYILIYLAAIVLMLYVATINLHTIKKYTLIILYITIFLVILTYFFGISVNKAQRWLKIPFIGLTIQPAEFLRIAFIIFVANKIAKLDQTKALTPKKLKEIFFWTLGIFAFIAIQNNSSAIILLLVVLTMIFFTNIDLKQFSKIILVSLAAIALIFIIAYILNIGRVGTFIARFRGDDTPHSQRNQALVAIASSDIFIQPGSSKQKYILPNSVSDFIFSIAIEEYGIVALIIFAAMYIPLFFRIGKIITSQKKAFPTYLAIGIGANIIYQTIIHILVNVGLIPVTGQPLPLISRGGSSVLAVCIQFGILMQISAKLYSTSQQEATTLENIDNDNGNFFENDTYAETAENVSFQNETFIPQDYENQLNYEKDIYNPVIDYLPNMHIEQNKIESENQDLRDINKNLLL